MSMCIYIYTYIYRYIWTYWKSILNDSCFSYQYCVISPLFFSGSASREFVCPVDRAASKVAVLVVLLLCYAIETVMLLMEPRDGCLRQKMGWLFRSHLGDFEIPVWCFFFFFFCSNFSEAWIGWDYLRTNDHMVGLYDSNVCCLYMQKF